MRDPVGVVRVAGPGVAGRDAALDAAPQHARVEEREDLREEQHELDADVGARVDAAPGRAAAPRAQREQLRQRPRGCRARDRHRQHPDARAALPRRRHAQPQHDPAAPQRQQLQGHLRDPPRAAADRRDGRSSVLHRRRRRRARGGETEMTRFVVVSERCVALRLYLAVMQQGPSYINAGGSTNESGSSLIRDGKVGWG